jgi:hypothetical protein
MESASPEELQKALQMAEEIALNHVVVSQLQSSYEYLKEEERVLRLLKDATASRDVMMLGSAIEQANKVKMAQKCKSKINLKMLDDAIQLKELLIKRQEIKKMIMDATVNENIKALREATLEAKALKLPEVDWQEAANFADVLEKEEHAFSQLEAALKGVMVELIEKRLAVARQITRLNAARNAMLTRASKIVLDIYREALDVPLIEIYD